MIGIGLGVLISQGASSARQSRPPSRSSPRRFRSSDNRAAMAAPAEPPPTTITSYMAALHSRVQFGLASVDLIHVPEHRRCRTVQHAGQLLAPDAGRNILAKRNIGRLIEGACLNLGRDFLLVLGGGRPCEGIAQRFHLWILRPADQAALATLAVQGNAHDGIHDVGDAPVGEEHIPAAVLWGLLVGEYGVL